jgi:type II secretory pathway pseudopilin PulG
MKVADADGKETVREVTETDLQYFASLDPASRRTEINRLFPEDKEEVKRHINEISRLYDASQAALQQARQQADGAAKNATEGQRQAQANRASLWKQTNEGLAAKYPAWFAPAENDAEGNTLFDRGRALADLVFSPQDLTKESLDLLPKSFAETIRAGKTFTQEQLVRMHSIIRNKAANHDRLAHQLHAAQSRIEELETSLKEYEESGPDGGRPRSRVPASGKDYMGEAAAELDAIDRAHPA